MNFLKAEQVEQAAEQPQVVHEFGVNDFTLTDKVDHAGRPIFEAPLVTITPIAGGEPTVEVGE